MLNNLRRRIRGILGAGAIWGGFGAVGGFVLGLVMGLFSPGSGVLSSAVEMMSGFAAFGLLGGVSFGSFVALVAARGDGHRLGPARGALLGALSGLALPAVIISQIPAGPAWGQTLLMATVAFGTLGGAAGFAYFKGAQSAPSLNPADEAPPESQLTSQSEASG